MRFLEFGVNCVSLINVKNIDWVEKEDNVVVTEEPGCIFHMNSGQVVYVDEKYENVIKLLEDWSE